MTSPLTGTAEAQDFHYNLPSALKDAAPQDVGLVCLPIQRKIMSYRKGANYTIMMVGESGLGKTSLINTLFNAILLPIKDRPGFSMDETGDDNVFTKRTTIIEAHRMKLTEDGFTINFTALDTPGFGDYIDNQYCWYPITRYIDEQYRRMVYQENQPDRSLLQHGEVHACLYFIKPSCFGLSNLDIEAMKSLSTRVNLIPVLAKADGCTPDEIKSVKSYIRDSLKENSIEICQFVKDSASASKLIAEMPFSIINTYGEVKGRQYDWGVAETMNPDHCDFVKLREFLMGSHMGDLILSTESYYEQYRADFMKYRLAKALEVDDMTTQSWAECSDDDETVVDEGSIVEGSIVEQHSTNVVEDPLENALDTYDATTVLKMIETISLKDIQVELTQLNPAYLDMEQAVKDKFIAMVKAQNVKFNEWKKNLFTKQAECNQDIDSIHEQLVKLQDEIRELGEV